MSHASRQLPFVSTFIQATDATTMKLVYVRDCQRAINTIKRIERPIGRET